MTTTEKTKQYVLETYGRFPLTVTRGEGTRVWDELGREYLDFCSGIAVCSLGHCHPALTQTITEQSATLMHCSNLYYIEQQADLAKLIVEKVVGHPGKIFFSNSGAEANDGLIKFARRFGKATGRYDVITFNKSFHGRTIGAMTATAQAKIHEGFDPLPTGFTYVEPNDLNAVQAALTDKTIAFLLEPIQGEGGVNPMTKEFLEGLAALAQKKDLLLLLDEVQCGFGRTGDLNGYDTIAPGLVPDGISWAKGMGGGFPIGSFYVAEKHAHLLGPGSHGSTYGGNALACAASKAVIETIIAENLTENVKTREAQVRKTIESWNHPAITEVRGYGLLLGIALNFDALVVPEGSIPSIHLCTALIEKGLLVPPAGPGIIRLLPPLNVSADEIDQALQLIKEALDAHLKS